MFKKKTTISCEVLVLSIRDNITEYTVNCSRDIFTTGSQRRERTESMEGTVETSGRVLEDWNSAGQRELSRVPSGSTKVVLGCMVAAK